MASGEKPNAAQQVKQLAASLKKHHFWLLLTVAVIASLTVWYMSTGELEAAFRNDTRKIDGSVGSLAGMVNSPLRNEVMIRDIEAEQGKIHKQSVDAWNVLFERQKPLFVWPTEVATISDLPTDQEIPLALRADFQQIVLKREWDKLFLIANPILGDGVAKPSADYVEKVDWPIAARDNLVNRYMAPGVTPSTIRVRTAMEDIWIYQNLLEIIRDINASANDRAEATIKRIRALEIAQWAIQGAHQNPGLVNEEVTGKRGSGRPFPPPIKPAASHPTDKAIMDGRYVDGDNNPIMSGAAPPFAEFRQMFVLMRFVMDQNAINELLARCANARFPIVARQVLVKFRDHDSIATKGDAFDNQAFNEYPAVRAGDALVEVRGLIFLYNPADAEDTPAEKRKLGTGTAPKPAHRKLGVPPLMTAQ
ncbi:MAG: hypothetical protein JNM18_06725 [Planctomycetaceae bacterium]|nr:hypothetical protein [Planctomycetaceae bacterium]